MLQSSRNLLVRIKGGGGGKNNIPTGKISQGNHHLFHLERRFKG
jgi:hypothetical protein